MESYSWILPAADKMFRGMGQTHRRSARQTTLHQAVRAGNIGTIADLLNSGVDVNSADKVMYWIDWILSRYSGLQYSKWIGCSALILIQYGFTSLMLASNNGYPDIIKLLLDRGANVNVESEVYYTDTVYLPTCWLGVVLCSIMLQIGRFSTGEQLWRWLNMTPIMVTACLCFWIEGLEWTTRTRWVSGGLSQNTCSPRGLSLEWKDCF